MSDATHPEVPTVTDLELAFGTTRLLRADENLNPSRESEEFIEVMFSRGLTATQERFELRPRRPITQAEGDAIFRTIQAHLTSYAPKHEHKITGMASLLDEWFTVTRLP